MQNCPDCQMLMEDHEVLCAHCAQDRAAAHAPVLTALASRGGGSAGATAVLERPTAVPMPTVVRYRNPGEHRRVAGMLTVLGVMVAGVVVLGVMALRGDGPLADVAVDVGLVAPPLVDVPDAWTTKVSEPGAFRVSMPASATELADMLDPQHPAAGSTLGYEAALGEGGSTTVVSTDFGMGAASVSAMDDPAAFDGLVSTLAAGLEGLTDHGTETVRRDVPVGFGRAVDVVIVDDVEGVTTRVRYVLANGRVYALVTSGVDEGAEQLDEVHARLLETFEPSV